MRTCLARAVRCVRNRVDAKSHHPSRGSVPAPRHPRRRRAAVAPCRPDVRRRSQRGAHRRPELLLYAYWSSATSPPRVAAPAAFQSSRRPRGGARFHPRAGRATRFQLTPETHLRWRRAGLTRRPARMRGCLCRRGPVTPAPALDRQRLQRDRRRLSCRRSARLPSYRLRGGCTRQPGRQRAPDQR